MEQEKNMKICEWAEGRTLYKKKGKKVRPVDVGYDNRERPAGDIEWRTKR